MPAAVYATIAKQIISLLNAQAVTTAYPASVTDISTSKRNPDEIKEAVAEADIEARVAICETPGNGFRSGFITVSPNLTPTAKNPHAAILPERVGPIIGTQIQIGTSLTYTPGEQAPLSEIYEIIQNPGNVFGVGHDEEDSPTAAYYFIDEASDMIHWTGNVIQVFYASIGAIDRATPTLLTPDAYSPFLVARGIALLHKHGDIPSFIQYYDVQATRMMAMIRQGAMVLPNVEPVTRAQVGA